MFDREFEKKVKRFLKQSGWTLQKTKLADFWIERDIFKLQVFLGPELFDLRFPAVEAFYSKKLFALKAAIPDAAILVILRDRNTLSLYKPIATIPVSILHFQELHLVNSLDTAHFDVAPFDDSLAFQLATSNMRLCRLMMRRAMNNNTPSRALFWGEKAAALDEHDPMLHFELAGVQLLLDQLKEAAQSVALAVNLLPDNAAILSRASIIALRQEDIPQALILAKRATETGNSRPSDYHHLARLYLRMSQFEAAERAVKQAILLQPDNAQFPITLAAIEKRKNNSFISDQ